MIVEARLSHSDPEPAILEPDYEETERELYVLYEADGGFDFKRAQEAARRGLSADDAVREAQERSAPVVPAF